MVATGWVWEDNDFFVELQNSWGEDVVEYLEFEKAVDRGYLVIPQFLDNRFLLKSRVMKYITVDQLELLDEPTSARSRVRSVLIPALHSRVCSIGLLPLKPVTLTCQWWYQWWFTSHCGLVCREREFIQRWVPSVTKKTNQPPPTRH